MDSYDIKIKEKQLETKEIKKLLKKEINSNRIENIKRALGEFVSNLKLASNSSPVYTFIKAATFALGISSLIGAIASFAAIPAFIFTTLGLLGAYGIEAGIQTAFDESDGKVVYMTNKRLKRDLKNIKLYEKLINSKKQKDLLKAQEIKKFLPKFYDKIYENCETGEKTVVENVYRRPETDHLLSLWTKDDEKELVKEKSIIKSIISKNKQNTEEIIETEEVIEKDENNLSI